MRKFVLTGIFAFMMVMTACSDKPVAAEQVPEPIKVFVQQMFPGQTITYAEKDQEVTGAKYDVVLTDGTRIDFDADDVWDIGSRAHRDVHPVQFPRCHDPED